MSVILSRRYLCKFYSVVAVAALSLATPEWGMGQCPFNSFPASAVPVKTWAEFLPLLNDKSNWDGRAKQFALLETMLNSPEVLARVEKGPDSTILGHLVTRGTPAYLRRAESLLKKFPLTPQISTLYNSLLKVLPIAGAEYLPMRDEYFTAPPHSKETWRRLAALISAEQSNGSAAQIIPRIFFAMAHRPRMTQAQRHRLTLNLLEASNELVDLPGVKRERVSHSDFFFIPPKDGTLIICAYKCFSYFAIEKDGTFHVAKWKEWTSMDLYPFKPDEWNLTGKPGYGPERIQSADVGDW